MRVADLLPMQVLGHTLDAALVKDYERVQEAFRSRFGKFRNAMKHVK